MLLVLYYGTLFFRVGLRRFYFKQNQVANFSLQPDFVLFLLIAVFFLFVFVFKFLVSAAAAAFAF